MKHNSFQTTSLLVPRTLFICGAFAFAFVFSACSDDDEPKKEDVPELITKATLTFTPMAGGSAVVATATDPDGEGVADLTVDGPINLDANTGYTLTIELINGLADPTEDEYDITAEVQEESDEHMFFFAWTNDVFSSPSGNGNVDNRADGVNYNDEDDNGLPLGLNTSWTSSAATASGTFRIILKHQPNLKSETSTATTGESDVDVTFNISVD